MSDDWPQIKARLEDASRNPDTRHKQDIRATLQRVEELESQRWYSAETRERELLKRVEGLEREVEKMEPWGRGLTARAEAAEAKLAEAQAEIDRLREALTFYSDTRRYQGANQPYRDGDDPFTPTGSPFLIDVMRDGGTIARAALRGGGK